jgi:hypothetical protein
VVRDCAATVSRLRLSEERSDEESGTLLQVYPEQENIISDLSHLGYLNIYPLGIEDFFMVEMMMPTIASFGMGQGVNDGPCGYSSACAKAAFMRIAATKGKEKAIEAQAMDLASAKSELVDLDPIGMTRYKVQKARFKDKVTGQIVDQNTLVSLDTHEPIAVWTSAGENGMGTKEEYIRIVDRANKLASVETNSSMFWVSPADTRGKDSKVPHRAFLWVRKDDEVTAYSYSLTGTRKSLGRMMEKLGYGEEGEDKSLEEQTILKQGKETPFSHHDVYEAFVSSLTEKEASASQNFIERFRQEADLPDSVREERVRAYKEKYEKELKAQYERDIQKTVEAYAQGFFHAVSPEEKAADANEQHYYRWQDRSEKDVARNVVIGYVDTSPAKDRPLTADATMPYVYKREEDKIVALEEAAVELLAIPLILAVATIQDEVPVSLGTEKTKKSNNDNTFVDVVSVPDKKDSNEKKDGHEGQNMLDIEQLLRKVAAKLFTKDELIVLQAPQHAHDSKVRSPQIPIRSESDQNKTTAIPEVLDFEISEFTQDSEDTRKAGEERFSVKKLQKAFEMIATSVVNEGQRTTTSETKMEDEIVETGKELFKILYVMRSIVPKQAEDLKVDGEVGISCDSLVRLGMLLAVYFEEDTTPPIKTLVSFLVFSEVRKMSISIGELDEDYPELIHVLRRFYDLYSGTCNIEERLKSITREIEALFGTLEKLVFLLLEELVLEKNQLVTIERLPMFSKAKFNPFKKGGNVKTIPKQKIIYWYTLLVNSGQFMTQYS